MPEPSFAIFVALGFAAQLVDGALGMAYGLICTSALLAAGVPPAAASASVHAAEVVTTGLAAGSHLWHRNVDWRLVRRLAGAGVVGGVLGAYVLTGLPGEAVRPFVSLYLLAITGVIAWRLFTGSTAEGLRRLGVAPVGAAGGFLDAIGGGGWGPVVTSTLVAQGERARHAIGSGSVSEFLVTAAISATFLATLDLAAYGRIVLGLIVGGALAAPFAGWFSRILPQRVLMAAVAVVVGGLGVYGLVALLGGA
ncbi:sulfite exporter TauE/SafE family protein [Methylobacterium sp. NEAU 140]|uniref:sulfite exporter TauE/SafE family protein n=1 Tax=Methylobacterium sp. NEAU 140 TaxID=3064945 RepID=UPI002734CE4F|nr:sulfite exporter TauE/SafE family protein [Methylobacterium sp. NEAU 140]MDP4024181.1 sulfite exporter TauE/SafE family protein [Methylobacterium sp. NEAU 140]